MDPNQALCSSGPILGPRSKNRPSIFILRPRLHPRLQFYQAKISVPEFLCWQLARHWSPRWSEILLLIPSPGPVPASWADSLEAHCLPAGQIQPPPAQESPSGALSASSGAIAVEVEGWLFLSARGGDIWKFKEVEGIQQQRGLRSHSQVCGCLRVEMVGEASLVSCVSSHGPKKEGRVRGSRNLSCFIKAGRWAKRADGTIGTRCWDKEDTEPMNVTTEARAGASISDGLPHIPLESGSSSCN